MSVFKTLYNISLGFYLTLLMKMILLQLQEIYSPKTVPITFITPEGDEQEVQAEIGSNLLEVAHANDIYLEGMY